MPPPLLVLRHSRPDRRLRRFATPSTASFHHGMTTILRPLDSTGQRAPGRRLRDPRPRRGLHADTEPAASPAAVDTWAGPARRRGHEGVPHRLGRLIRESLLGLPPEMKFGRTLPGVRNRTLRRPRATTPSRSSPPWISSLGARRPWSSPVSALAPNATATAIVPIGRRLGVQIRRVRIR